jgi:hypothetical protein
MEDGMTTTSILSRRTLVASAAALPALAVPAVASAAPTQTAPTTLPPDLIERFVRMRAWFLDDHKQTTLFSAEVGRRFFAATGMTNEEYWDLKWNDPGIEKLRAVRRQIGEQLSGRNREEWNAEEEAETAALGDERWEVCSAIMDHTPQTITDLAWQAEAFLIADMEIVNSNPPTCPHDQMRRLFFHRIRTLGALPQPEDPFGALAINIEPVPDCEDVETDESVTESEAAAVVAAPVPEPSSWTGGQVYDRYVALDQSKRDCVVKLITYLSS